MGIPAAVFSIALLLPDNATISSLVCAALCGPVRVSRVLHRLQGQHNALAYLLIYCDIMPYNMLIMPDFTLKAIDIGEIRPEADRARVARHLVCNLYYLLTSDGEAYWKPENWLKERLCGSAWGQRYPLYFGMMLKYLDDYSAERVLEHPFWKSEEAGPGICLSEEPMFAIVNNMKCLTKAAWHSLPDHARVWLLERGVCRLVRAALCLYNRSSISAVAEEYHQSWVGLLRCLHLDSRKEALEGRPFGVKTADGLSRVKHVLYPCTHAIAKHGTKQAMPNATCFANPARVVHGMCLALQCITTAIAKLATTAYLAFFTGSNKPLSTPRSLENLLMKSAL